LVYIPFFISHVPPAHSFFKKKSILKNLCQICGNLFFAAYSSPVSGLAKRGQYTNYSLLFHFFRGKRIFVNQPVRHFELCCKNIMFVAHNF